MVGIQKPNPQLKQLLQDLERKGGLHKADFHGICKNNTGFYGVKGSSVRRNYQAAIDRLKRRKTAQEYKEIVEANGVTPCSETVQNAMDELKERMAKATVSDTKAADTKADTKAADAKPEKKVVVTEPPRPTTPPPPPMKILFSPPASPGLFATDISVTSVTADQTVSQEEGSSFDSTVGWLRENPHIIPVPYGNGALPHGFVSMFSESVGNDEWKHERDVFFLCKVIGGDLAKWKASIPNDFPQYQNRCILVEGPGLDYIQIDPKTMIASLEETLKINKCPIKTWLATAFRRAVKKLRNAYVRSNKKNQYYLFVYGEGTQFENSAITGEGSANTVKTFGIKVNSKFGVFTKKEHTNMVAFWAVATIADEDRRTDGVDDTLAEDVYDF